MPDRTAAARFDVLDFSAGNTPEWFAFENLLDIISKQIAAFEVAQADEFAAREHVAIRSKSEEASTTAARRDVAHESTGSRS